MGRGEVLNVCTDCWNASVDARRRDRKQELAEHWRKESAAQSEAMAAAGAQIGQRVSYFCRSMLGLGGYTVSGTITRNRNGLAVVRLDRLYEGKRFTQWTKEWRLSK